MEDNDDDNDFDMFKERDIENDIFYFKRIEIKRLKKDDIFGLEIYFIYNFANEVEIKSVLKLDRNLFDVLVQEHTNIDNDNIYINKVFDDLENSPRFFRIILSIGLCILPWYWMGFACKSIVIEEEATRGLMNDEMLDFWDDLYNNVLLEFMYMHKLSWHISIRVVGLNNRNITASDDWINSNVNDNRTLIALGGGKDSLVALHLAEMDNKVPVLMYSADGFLEFEASWRLQKIAEVSKKELFIMRHEIQSSIFEKHARSYCYPCGHPWAALCIFDSLLVCSITKINSVSLGFEKSADEGNGVYVNDVEVNHQYDKSSVFLAKAKQYINRHINPTLSVSSRLANMWELEISRIFCERLKKYHHLFISCNEPVNEAEWCLKCEKCCFLFLLISSWLSPEETVSIFGENLFEKEELLNVFLSLVGIKSSKYNHKPFECVGTVPEAKAAVHLCTLKYMKYLNDNNNNDNIVNDNCKHVPKLLLELCKHLDHCKLDKNGMPPVVSIEEILVHVK